MIKKNLATLGKPVWFKPFESDPMEVELIPAAMPDNRGRLWGVSSETLDMRVCRMAFVNFRNYWEDDNETTEIENTLEERLWLWQNVPGLRQVISDKMDVLNNEVLLGEDVAVSG